MHAVLRQDPGAQRRQRRHLAKQAHRALQGAMSSLQIPIEINQLKLLIGQLAVEQLYFEHGVN